jgi:hypothetical protein
MKNILRALLFGAVLGVLLGIHMTERGVDRLEKERHDAWVNNPEMIKLRKQAQRDRQADQWADEIEKEIDDDEE